MEQKDVIRVVKEAIQSTTEEINFNTLLGELPDPDKCSADEARWSMRWIAYFLSPKILKDEHDSEMDENFVVKRKWNEKTHESNKVIIQENIKIEEIKKSFLNNNDCMLRFAEYANRVSPEKMATRYEDKLGTPYDFLNDIRRAPGKNNLFLKAVLDIKEKKGSINQESALASVIKSHRTTLGWMASWFGKRTATEEKMTSASSTNQRDLAKNTSSLFFKNPPDLKENNPGLKLTTTKSQPK